MRLIDHSFWVSVATLLLESAFVRARPAPGDLAVRDGPSSSSTTIPAQSTTVPSSSGSSSTSVSNSSSTSHPSTILSGTSRLASLVSAPSPTTHSTTATPTETAANNDPAFFFSNTNSRIILISTVGGIVGIVAILILWINFRRSWYFPWNKKKQRYNPNRWSVYSYREKPRLTLGRNIEITPSTENFARRDANNDEESSAHGHGTSDGHGIGTSEGHGYRSSDGHGQLLTMPPVPQITIDSPTTAASPASAARSRTWSFARPLPPGLGHHSRWSTATSHVSAATMSVYSENSHSFVEDVRTADRYAAGERVVSMNRPLTGTTTSSDNALFRFDNPIPSSGRLNSNDDSSTPMAQPSNIPSAFIPRAMTRERRVQYIDSVAEESEPSHYHASTRGSSILRELDEEESNTSGPVYGLSALKVKWEQTPSKMSEMQEMSNVDLAQAPVISSPYTTTAPARSSPLLASYTPSTSYSPPKLSPLSTSTKPGPKGILKSPHYLTTSERMARNGRANRI